MLSIALFLLLGPTIFAVDAPERYSSVSFGLRHTYSQSDESASPSFAHVEQSHLQATHTLQARPTTVYRPRSQAALERARLRSLHHAESEKVEWDEVDILGPDIENRHTLSQLARMTGNAYALPGRGWYDIDQTWNTVRTTSLSY